MGANLMNEFGLVSVIIGLLLLIIFGYYELKIETPAFNMNLFRNRRKVKEKNYYKSRIKAKGKK